jgi:hypothetical protein
MSVENVEHYSVLRRYALTESFEEAVKELSSFVDPSKLAKLLKRLEEWGYELEGFTLLKDPEFSEPLAVAIHVEGCNLEEWEAVERDIKQRFPEEGLGDLAGKVTIVCIDAFRPGKGEGEALSQTPNLGSMSTGGQPRGEGTWGQSRRSWSA